jgi:hypothetical protein
MVLAWVLTLPAAAIVAGLAWELADAVGSEPMGSVVMAALAAVAAVALFLVTQSRGRGQGRGRRVMLAAIVDTAALWKIVLAVFLVGVGVTAISARARWRSPGSSTRGARAAVPARSTSRSSR